MRAFCLALIFAVFLIQNPAQGADRVSLLLEHAENSPWTDLLRQGLEKAGREFDLDTRVIIAPDNENQTEIFRAAAGDSELVLVTGESLHKVLRNNASKFRRVKFGCIDAGIRAANIMCVTFADQEAAFLAGAAAALTTGSTRIKGINNKNIIGWLSGMDTPAMRTLYNGFQEGARLVDPDIVIAQGVVGSFTDSVAAAQKSRALLEAGADIIALAAGAGNSGANTPLEEFGAWRIGLDKNVPAARKLATIVKAADKAVYEIVSAFAEGAFKGKEIIVYNLENGGVDLAGIDSFLKEAGPGVSANFKRRLNEIRSELLKGNIHIRSLRTRTLCDCLD